MPDDTSGFFVRRVLESPWPTVVVLGLMAAALVWLALGRDDRRLLIGGGILGLLAIVVGVVGTMVVTDRERALAATTAFVDDAVAGRIDDLLAWLHPDATLHVARIESPGYPRESLERALGQLDGVHRIQDNSITLLDAADDGSGSIWVELACLTRTDSSYGTVPSRWIFEWMPPPSGRPWEIRSITAISVAGRAPSGGDVFR
ncbi:MAG: hypothetical protein RLZZ461_432 [Planctomycetota bacterium]|jgi:hypothetical protein